MTHTPQTTAAGLDADAALDASVEGFILAARDLMHALERVVGEVAAEEREAQALPANAAKLEEVRSIAVVRGAPRPRSPVTAGALLGSEEFTPLRFFVPVEVAASAEEALQAGEPEVGRQPDLGQPDLAQPDLGQPDMAQPDLAQPDMAQPDLSQPETPAEPRPAPEEKAAVVPPSPQRVARVDPTPAASGTEGYTEHYRRKIDVLRRLIERRDSVFVPEASPFAPLGHACTEVDELLELPPGEGLEVLEDLGDLGLLERELENLVHVCPSCRKSQLNLREACPVCASIDLDIERLIHHFHCAYSGLESEFVSGLDMVCPKCRKPLRQLGQDFERPHETYICRTSGHLFEEPYIEGQCLHCSHQCPGAKLEVVRIYRYRPTLLTVRAVELGRLTGLDMSEIMFDENLRLATRGFLEIELRRELLRVARHGGSFVTAILTFEDGGRPYPVFREWSAETVRQMATVLASCFRTLDLVSRLDHKHLAVLLIETDQDGRVGERVLECLDELVFRTRTGAALQPVWSARAWSDKSTTIEEVLGFFGVEEPGE
jgi:hypothetical protein